MGTPGIQVVYGWTNQNDKSLINPYNKEFFLGISKSLNLVTVVIVGVYDVIHVYRLMAFPSFKISLNWICANTFVNLS